MKLKIFRRDASGILSLSTEEWENEEQYLDYFNLSRDWTTERVLGWGVDLIKWHGNIGFGYQTGV